MFIEELLKSLMKLHISKIREFDVLLYPKNIFGKTLFYHCAWYVGRVWGMRVNFESTSRGPEFEEWENGEVPKYVCRLKASLTLAQKQNIREECGLLKDRGYDWLGFFGHYLALDHPKLMRCDELIEIPLIGAGIDPQRPERRPSGFMESPVFDVYEVK